MYLRYQFNRGVLIRGGFLIFTITCIGKAFHSSYGVLIQIFLQLFGIGNIQHKHDTVSRFSTECNSSKHKSMHLLTVLYTENCRLHLKLQDSRQALCKQSLQWEYETETCLCVHFAGFFVLRMQHYVCMYSLMIIVLV